MAKLKNIIKQLSADDYQSIYSSLIESNAEKSAYLLHAMRERQLPDHKIMDELEVNNNAYYTLRSRLNQKIEEHLLQQMESPRTDILKNVANINEIIFTKKRAIAITTLKKLEKELLDYDLSNELTVVYKSLKKLHVNTQDHFHYSQLYNKHVAYMLAVDKAEDILSEYFKKYGEYSLNGEETDKLGLSLMLNELSNVSVLYQSHRLYVYYSCVNIFHRLFVEPEEEHIDDDQEAIEDVLDKVQDIFDSYQLDSIYYHLNLVFEFLKLEYYNHYKLYRKAEKYYEEVNDATENLLTNYSIYTYPTQFLITKVMRHLRMGTEKEIYEENIAVFQNFESNASDVPQYINYILYRAVSCYYTDKYDEAARFINNLLNEVSLKKYPVAQLEIKAILALQYCLMEDYDLFNQLINSIQRQIRLIGKEKCEHLLLFTKMLKISLSDVKKNKNDKISELARKLNLLNIPHTAHTRLIKISDELIKKLSK